MDDFMGAPSWVDGNPTLHLQLSEPGCAAYAAHQHRFLPLGRPLGPSCGWKVMVLGPNQTFFARARRFSCMVQKKEARLGSPKLAALIYSWAQFPGQTFELSLARNSDKLLVKLDGLSPSGPSC